MKAILLDGVLYRGDRVVEGAPAGLSGLLARTGKFRERDLDGEVRPDAVLDSVAQLPRWWETHHG